MITVETNLYWDLERNHDNVYISDGLNTAGLSN